MKNTPLGQRWTIKFIDAAGEDNGGFINDFKGIPFMIQQILNSGGSSITIRDDTLYAEETPKGNVYHLHVKRKLSGACK